MTLEARWYQQEAEDAVFDYVENRDFSKPSNPVVAMPTGTGKSVVIGRVVKRAMHMRPLTRFMLLTHVKQLIEQNADKLRQIWPNAPLGIYSAGLKQRDTSLPIIYGGVKSVVNCVRDFGPRDALLIDECHLLSPDSESMYQKVIAELLAMNPYLIVIGFTATAYRMKQGMITDGGLFTDICYDCTDAASFNRLVYEGFLCPLIPKRPEAFIDIAGVKVVAGEFSAKGMAEAADREAITREAVRETVMLGEHRGAWLNFATSIEHAEHIAEMQREYGIVAAAVHSKLSAKENDARIEAFKRGEIRSLVNNGMLTTGFDHPPIDLIGMYRPTLSPGLWVQMLGRGTRPWELTKRNTLVLDFARNAERLGPINDPVIPRKPGKGGGDAPVRICSTGYRYYNGIRVEATDGCDCYNHASARECINCGMEFPMHNKLVQHAGTTELIKDEAPIVNYMQVDRVIYKRHTTFKGSESMEVMYFCGFQVMREFISFGSKHGFVKHRTKQWWGQRSSAELPTTVDEALSYTQQLREPTRIRVWANKNPYPEVMGYEF